MKFIPVVLTLEQKVEWIKQARAMGCEWLILIVDRTGEQPEFMPAYADSSYAESLIKMLEASGHRVERIIDTGMAPGRMGEIDRAHIDDELLAHFTKLAQAREDEKVPA